MRNLKRVLSLAMAAAMLIGMMVVSAGAVSTYEDFTDKDEIQNTEAVNTMVSLGVINGKDDGSYFDPSGIVTRAEMAALIARCLNGGIDPNLGSGAATTQFSDTKGHWAEAYIAYCANLGIINGKGDGTFGPDEQVTGTAAAKMFLCALGYRSEIEGLTGTGWDLNTDSLANKTGLYDEMGSIRPSDGLNRDNTAQLVYNGVQASEVQYQNNYGEYSGVIYAQPNGTMLWNRFRVVKVTGVLLANDVMAVSGATAQEGKSRLAVRGAGDFSDEQISNMGSTFKVSTPNEMIGQEIVLYVKFLNNLSPNADSATVMGEAILTNRNNVYETSAKMDTAQKVRDAIKGAGLDVTYSWRDAVLDEDGNVVTAAGNVCNAATIFYSDAGRVGSPYADGIVDGAGLSQRFIDNNNDGTVDYIIQELPRLEKITNINTNGGTISFTGTVGTQDLVDVIGADDMAKDDFVLIISYDGIKYRVSDPETVEGTVTAYNSGNKKITIDGSAYGASIALNTTAAGLSTTALADTVGDGYRLYLDAHGNIVGYAFLEAALSNLAVVISSGASQDALNSYTGRVKLILADGTTMTREVNLVDSARRLGADTSAVTTDTAKSNWTVNALTSGIATANTKASGDKAVADGTKKDGMKFEIVSWSEDTEGGAITLTNPAVMNSNSYVYANSSSAQQYGSKVTSYNGTLADNSTVFFIWNSDSTQEKFSVVTGLNSLSSTAKDSSALSAANSNQNTMTVVTLGYKPNASTNTQLARAVVVQNDSPTAYIASSSYAYVIDKFVKVGTDLYEYPVVLQDGTVTTLTTKDNNWTKGTVVAYSLDGQGYAVIDDSVIVHTNVGNVATAGTYNGYVIDTASGSSLNFQSGYDKSKTVHFVVGADAKCFDVSDVKAGDQDSVSEISTLGQNQSTCFVIEDDYIKYVFVDDNNALFARVTNRTGSNLTTVQGAALNNGDSVEVASGYTVSIAATTPAAVAYNYTVGTRSYQALAEAEIGSTVSFTMPANTTRGVELVASNSEGATSGLGGYTPPVGPSPSPSPSPSPDVTLPADSTAAQINTELTKPENANMTFEFNPSGPFTADSAIAVGANQILKITGNVTDTAGNIANSGHVEITGNYTTGEASGLGNVKVTGTLTANATTTSIDGTVEAATLANGSATTISVGSSGVLKVTDNNSNAAITSSGTLEVNKTGTGTLTINGGTAKVGTTASGGAFTGGPVGENLVVNGTATNVQAGAVTGTVSVAGATNDVTVASIAGTTVDVDAGQLHVTGAISNANAVVTVDGGTLTVDGAISGASAAVTVNGGELVAEAATVDLTMTNAGKATVAGLTGTFSDQAGNILIVKGAAANTTGITTINGTVTFEDAVAVSTALVINKAVTFEDVSLDGGSITVAATGTVTITGALDDEVSITGATDGATLIFGDNATVTATLDGGKFLDDSDSAITNADDLKGQTFVWSAADSAWTLQAG